MPASISQGTCWRGIPEPARICDGVLAGAAELPASAEALNH
jgi:hypothetical protein